MRRGLEELGGDDLALAAHHAVHRARRVLEDLLRRERRAVPTREDEALRRSRARGLREVDHFRDVREVVQREADRLRLPLVEEAEVVGVLEALEIEEADLVASPSHRLRHQLETQGLQPEVDPRVHQGAGMDEQDSHGEPLCLPDRVPREDRGETETWVGADGRSREAIHRLAGSAVKSATSASRKAAAVMSPNCRRGGKLETDRPRNPAALMNVAKTMARPETRSACRIRSSTPAPARSCMWWKKWI